MCVFVLEQFIFMENVQNQSVRNLLNCAFILHLCRNQLFIVLLYDSIQDVL